MRKPSASACRRVRRRALCGRDARGLAGRARTARASPTCVPTRNAMSATSMCPNSLQKLGCAAVCVVLRPAPGSGAPKRSPGTHTSRARARTPPPCGLEGEARGSGCTRTPHVSPPWRAVPIPRRVARCCAWARPPPPPPPAAPPHKLSLRRLRSRSSRRPRAESKCEQQLVGAGERTTPRAPKNACRGWLRSAERASQ
jgi:hypothetical protein